MWDAALHDHVKLKNLKFPHSKIKPKNVKQNTFLNKNLFPRQKKTAKNGFHSRKENWVNNQWKSVDPMGQWEARKVTDHSWGNSNGANRYLDF